MLLSEHEVLHAVLESIQHLLTLWRDELTIPILVYIICRDGLKIVENVLLCNLSRIKSLKGVGAFKHLTVKLIDLSPVYLGCGIKPKGEHFSIGD